MNRIDGLDLWRSVCVWMMLAYHTLFDLSVLGVLPAGLMTRPGMRLWAVTGAGGFVLLSGVCVRLSNNPLRRGIVVLCAAALVTAATALLGYPVWFGTLHLLGVCMLLYVPLRPRLAQAGPGFSLACLGLFALAGFVTERVSQPFDWLFPLGFHSARFVSYDYFPLLPWAFLFFAGVPLGKVLRPGPRLHPALTFCGRHSLIIYLLHQPVLYGFCWLLAK